jgi:hypothetical protein
MSISSRVRSPLPNSIISNFLLTYLPVETISFYRPILGENVEMTEEVTEMGYPLEHPHKLCCLRQELVDAFVESRYMTFIKVAAYHLQKYGFKNQAVQENLASSVDEPSADSPAIESLSESKKEGKGEEKAAIQEEEATATLVENAAKTSEKIEGRILGLIWFKFLSKDSVLFPTSNSN